MFVYEKNGRRRPAVEVICDYCSKKFLKAKRVVGDVNYCCHKHYNASQLKKIDVMCSYCGIIKKITQSKYDASKTKNFFCNRDCQSNAQNTSSGINYSCNYKGGSTIYRKLALETYANECEECGYNDFIQVLDVHHIDSDRENNNIDNLIILCPNHHTLITRGLAILDNRKIKLVN